MTQTLASLKRKLVVIESPYAANSIEESRRNADYLRKAMRHSIFHGEAPFASHMIYTQVLDDKIAGERATGIEMGFAWGENADLIAIYTDLGITDGMRRGIAHYESLGIPIEYRTVPIEGLDFI